MGEQLDIPMDEQMLSVREARLPLHDPLGRHVSAVEADICLARVDPVRVFLQSRPQTPAFDNSAWGVVGWEIVHHGAGMVAASIGKFEQYYVLGNAEFHYYESAAQASLGPSSNMFPYNAPAKILL